MPTTSQYKFLDIITKAEYEQYMNTRGTASPDGHNNGGHWYLHSLSLNKYRGEYIDKIFGLNKKTARNLKLLIKGQ